MAIHGETLKTFKILGQGRNSESSTFCTWRHTPLHYCGSNMHSYTVGGIQSSWMENLVTCGPLQSIQSDMVLYLLHNEGLSRKTEALISKKHRGAGLGPSGQM